MSDYQPPPNPYAGPQPYTPPPRPGMSTGAKVLVILGIIFVVLAILCCGGIAAMTFWTRSYVKNAFSQDPQVVRRVTAEMLTIDMPTELQPQASINAKIPFTGQEAMRMVIYAHEASNSSIVLMSFNPDLGQQNQAQFDRQMDDALRQRGLSQKEHEEQANWQSKSEERELQVAGKPVNFTFTRRTNADSKEERLDVRGTVQGKTGPVMIAASVDTSVVSEEKLVETIESIQ